MKLNPTPASQCVFLFFFKLNNYLLFCKCGNDVLFLGYRFNGDIYSHIVEDFIKVCIRLKARVPTLI